MCVNYSEAGYDNCPLQLHLEVGPGVSESLGLVLGWLVFPDVLRDTRKDVSFAKGNGKSTDADTCDTAQHM